jgi:hypothetical protein
LFSKKEGRKSRKSTLLFLPVCPYILEMGALGFWGRYNIDEFEAVVAKWVRRHNINLCEDSPVICAIRSFFHNKFSFHVDRYFKVTQKRVELGAELHCTSDTTDLSLLHRILAEARELAEVSKIFKF